MRVSSRASVPRTALVTGGGTGIGRGIARALARRGVCVALVGRRRAPLDAVVGELAALGARGVALPADLALPGARAALMARVRAALGPLDLLVNNAGLLPGGHLTTLTADEIERVVAVNLTAPLDLTRLALPDLAARRGAIVLIGSVVSVVPLPSAALYAATKAGLRAFGQALRYEVEPQGVRLLIAYPPGVDTAMVRGMAAATRLAATPLYRLAAPEVIGERLVAALLTGRAEVTWGGGERALMLLHHMAPGLVRALLRWQRPRLDRILAAARGIMTEDDVMSDE